MTFLRFSAALLAASAASAAALPAQAQPVRSQPTRAASPRQTSVDSLIDRVGRAYKRVKSTRATFEQTLVNPLTGSSTVQTGELLQQGKRWSARFTNPRDDRYVLDGRALWIYTPSSAPKQVIRLGLDPDAVANFDIVKQFAGEPREQFAITSGGAATVSGRATHALQLVPKTPGRVAKAIVWVDDRDATLRQFEITENTGLVRRVRFATVKFNVAVPASEFVFTAPSGVRVIDQPAGASAP